MVQRLIPRAVEQLWSLHALFQYDEELKLPLPIEQGRQFDECRDAFFTWMRETYPEADPEGVSERELWEMLKDEFLQGSHSERITAQNLVKS